MHDEVYGGVWAEIDLDAVIHNVREIRKRLDPKTIFMGVVKANAYGHGAIMIAKTLLENGVEYLAVATLSEALELRYAGVAVPILILSYTPNERLIDAVRYDITPTIYRYDQAKAVSEAAKSLDKTAKIHLKVDTGMSRLGLLPSQESLGEISRMMALSNVYIEGIFTHFAMAYSDDKSYTHQQAKVFLDFCRQVTEMGYEIPLRHVCNSAAATLFPEYNLEMVRVGSALFGLPHKPNLSKEVIDLKVPMTLKTRISNLKVLSPGEGVSYGLTYQADQERLIASIPAGYVDGLTRIGSGKFKVLVNGQKVPQVGIICMDQCMIDVTDVEGVFYDDEVILLGSDGEQVIENDDNAMILGTGNCEIVCSVGHRVPRVYMYRGQVVSVNNDLLKQYK